MKGRNQEFNAAGGHLLRSWIARNACPVKFETTLIKQQKTAAHVREDIETYHEIITIAHEGLQLITENDGSKRELSRHITTRALTLNINQRGSPTTSLRIPAYLCKLKTNNSFSSIYRPITGTTMSTLEFTGGKSNETTLTFEFDDYRHAGPEETISSHEIQSQLGMIPYLLIQHNTPVLEIIFPDNDGNAVHPIQGLPSCCTVETLRRDYRGRATQVKVALTITEEIYTNTNGDTVTKSDAIHVAQWNAGIEDVEARRRDQEEREYKEHRARRLDEKIEEIAFNRTVGAISEHNIKNKVDSAYKVSDPKKPAAKPITNYFNSSTTTYNNNLPHPSGHPTRNPVDRAAKFSNTKEPTAKPITNHFNNSTTTYNNNLPHPSEHHSLGNHLEEKAADEVIDGFLHGASIRPHDDLPQPGSGDPSHAQTNKPNVNGAHTAASGDKTNASDRYQDSGNRDQESRSTAKSPNGKEQAPKQGNTETDTKGQDPNNTTKDEAKKREGSDQGNQDSNGPDQNQSNPADDSDQSDTDSVDNSQEPAKKSKDSDQSDEASESTDQNSDSPAEKAAKKDENPDHARPDTDTEDQDQNSSTKDQARKSETSDHAEQDTKGRDQDQSRTSQDPAQQGEDRTATRNESANDNPQPDAGNTQTTDGSRQTGTDDNHDDSSRASKNPDNPGEDPTASGNEAQKDKIQPDAGTKDEPKITNRESSQDQNKTVLDTEETKNTRPEAFSSSTQNNPTEQAASLSDAGSAASSPASLASSSPSASSRNSFGGLTNDSPIRSASRSASMEDASIGNDLGSQTVQAATLGAPLAGAAGSATSSLFNSPTTGTQPSGQMLEPSQISAAGSDPFDSPSSIESLDDAMDLDNLDNTGLNETLENTLNPASLGQEGFDLPDSELPGLATDLEAVDETLTAQLSSAAAIGNTAQQMTESSFAQTASVLGQRVHVNVNPANLMQSFSANTTKTQASVANGPHPTMASTSTIASKRDSNTVPLLMTVEPQIELTKYAKNLVHKNLKKAVR
jgi:hypothetical protein